MGSEKKEAELNEIEKHITEYLKDKGSVRFSELYEWHKLSSANPVTKGYMSKKLDSMAEKNIIFSWHEGSARYISLSSSIEKIRKDVLRTVDKLCFKKGRITFGQIREKLPYPPDMIREALTYHVGQGNILNTTSEEKAYYEMPPIHKSVFVGLAMAVMVSLLYVVNLFNESIVRETHLFVLLLVVITVISYLWYKLR